jgi:hypothetical protein
MNRNRAQSGTRFDVTRDSKTPPEAFLPSPPLCARDRFLHHYVVDAIFGTQGKAEDFDSPDAEGKPSAPFAKFHGWQTVRKIFDGSAGMDCRSAAAGMIDQARKCDVYAVSFFEGVAEAVEFLHRRTPEDPARMWLGLLARYLNDHPGDAFPVRWRPTIGDLREFLKCAGYAGEHTDKHLAEIWRKELDCRCAPRGHPRKKEFTAVLRILGDPFHWLTFEGKSVPR